MSEPERPSTVQSHTICAKVGCGHLYVTVSTQDDWPEVFLKLGKPGGCPSAFLQALARVCSFAMRAGVPKERIIHACKDISCPSPMWDGGEHNLSCPDAIARVLDKMEK